MRKDEILWKPAKEVEEEDGVQMGNDSIDTIEQNRQNN
jgi:hypothetical protein